MTHAFGIDIGGSGIKGGLVDLKIGQLIGERCRLPTPQPATPKAVAKTVAKVIDHFGGDAAGLPIGLTVPAIVTHGYTRSAANIDKKWIDAPVFEIFSTVLGRPVSVLNDADAAGLAEVHYGSARGNNGLVIVTTLGTGIGSALIYRGVLVPNAELGHIQIDGFEAEKRAAASVRTKEDLSWADFGKRLQEFYATVEFLFSPDLFVVGGGISRNSDKFLPLLSLKTPIVPAALRNHAGIVGAAWAAAQAHIEPDH
ncbi:MAG: ROK family protein [Propionibacteriaceae bacterium]|jgi:polyphosphate glucokinase|nr:ROK family protein [Propionibacteriaceae bacterium]